MMIEKNTDVTPESEEPKAGVSQALADDVAALAAEIRRMERAAAKGWKITAVAFIVLLAFIAGYLKVLVYDKLDYYLEPETLVALGTSYVDAALQPYGVPSLDNAHMLPDWAADKAKAMAPQLVERLKPQVEQMIQQLPQRREELLAQVRQKLPEFIDEHMAKLSSDYLPRARKEIIRRVDHQLNRLLVEADDQLRDLVDQIIAQHGENFDNLMQEQRLRQAIENAFEERLGPYIDEQVLARVDKHIKNAAAAMEELVTKPNKSLEEQLDIRIIQIVRALFEKIGEEGALELRLPGGMPPPTRRAVRKAVERGMVPSAEAPGKWVIPPDMPDEEKQLLLQAIEKGEIPAPSEGGWTLPESMPKAELDRLKAAVEKGLVPPPAGGVEAFDKVKVQEGE